MLVQLPIFIALYGMLVSPNFLAAAGNDSFFFIENLAQPLRSHAGEALDGTFSVKPDDKFITANEMHFAFKNGKSATYKVSDNRNVLQVEPQPLIPDSPMSLNINPQFVAENGINESFIREVKTATLMVVNDSTKEVEKMTFAPVENTAEFDPTSQESMSTLGWKLSSKVPTAEGVDSFHPGVLWLVLIYAGVTFLYQRVMQKDTPKAEGPQAQMMKLMPFMFVGFLVFFPIPSGVMLYLVVTMLLMFIQTAIVKASDDDTSKSTQKPSKQIVDIVAK